MLSNSQILIPDEFNINFLWRRRTRKRRRRFHSRDVFSNQLVAARNIEVSSGASLRLISDFALLVRASRAEDDMHCFMNQNRSSGFVGFDVFPESLANDARSRTPRRTLRISTAPSRGSFHGRGWRVRASGLRRSRSEG